MCCGRRLAGVNCCLLAWTQGLPCRGALAPAGPRQDPETLVVGATGHLFLMGSLSSRPRVSTPGL